MFELTRTNSWDDKPINSGYNIRKQKVTYRDFRNISTLKEAKTKFWFQSWYDRGTNHREEKGMIVCDRKEKREIWVIDICSLEELMKFKNEFGEIIIMDSEYLEVSGEIEIYDGHRE